ncbi:hypothetical protein F5B22DRAFT_652727 [Xylaria bambusicola]|uniref:uncharacterized protein n=1 Tax=Xylaria bambusicola TaxID=326684 RepID=UPI00200854ED|nr:uncharacterized protein F5B22DRAFT_652727 [Xylaria bambusicola]KAI0502800.1 hypothetical protein F5B22DRAFT_652727 [Xylaria bambusicola]
MLNGLLDNYNTYERICSDEFLRETNDPPCPVPEDFALRGLLFVDDYFPSAWFANDKIDDDEKYFEMALMRAVRKERLLWLGYRIAQSSTRLTYDEDTKTFGVSRDTRGTSIPDAAGST